jgi:hypothetical protein
MADLEKGRLKKSLKIDGSAPLKKRLEGKNCDSA